MEKQYQICEIKDDTKSFIELSVSTVPEIWIFEDEGGTIWCYWPKYNALKKIKSFEQPKPGRGWTTYKCRILMNEGNAILKISPTPCFRSLAKFSIIFA